jgi:hypothetical protein
MHVQQKLRLHIKNRFTMLKKIEPFTKLISSIGTIASFVLWIISIILGKKIENPEGFIQTAFEFLYSNRMILWICFVCFAILYLSYNLYRINKLFTLGFKDNFKSNLQDNVNQQVICILKVNIFDQLRSYPIQDIDSQSKLSL